MRQVGEVTASIEWEAYNTLTVDAQERRVCSTKNRKLFFFFF